MLKFLAMLAVLSAYIALFLVYCLIIVTFLAGDDQNEDVDKGNSSDKTV